MNTNQDLRSESTNRESGNADILTGSPDLPGVRKMLDLLLSLVSIICFYTDRRSKSTLKYKKLDIAQGKA